jgi:hypothetical protein
MQKFGVILALGCVWGCGGTTTNEGVNPYNRANGSYDQAPTSSIPGSPAAGEVVAVNAFLNAGDVADAKAAGAVVDQLKKLPVPPKRIFLLGVTADSAEWYVKPLAVAKITPIPVIGVRSGNWDKILKTLNVGKLYGNGPKLGGPNADMLTADQSKQSSTFVFEGVRFVSLNTDTPVKGGDAGAVPRLWLQARLNEAKENSIFILGWRAIRAADKDDKTPVVATQDLFGKNAKVRGFIAGAGTAPSLSRPDDKSLYQMSVGGGVGEDKQPTIGILEIRKNGSVLAKLVKLEGTKPAKSVLEASLYDPVPTNLMKPTPEKVAK